MVAPSSKLLRPSASSRRAVRTIALSLATIASIVEPVLNDALIEPTHKLHLGDLPGDDLGVVVGRHYDRHLHETPFNIFQQKIPIVVLDGLEVLIAG